MERRNLSHVWRFVDGSWTNFYMKIILSVHSITYIFPVELNKICSNIPDISCKCLKEKVTLFYCV